MIHGIVASQILVTMGFLLLYPPTLLETDNNILKDKTNNNNNGILGGASYGTFDGSSYCIGQTSNVYESDNVVFSVIFKTTENGECCLFSKAQTSLGLRGFTVTINNGRLYFYISQDGIIQNAYSVGVNASDGNWHIISGEFTPNLISGEFDAQSINIVTTETSIFQNTVPVGIQCYNVLTTKNGRNNISIAYVKFGYIENYFSQNFGGEIPDENGGEDLILTNATYSTFWNTDDTGEIYNRNIIKGCNRWSHTTSPDIYVKVGFGVTESGYTYSETIPPLTFGNHDWWFTIPYNSELKLRDENDLLFTGTTPNKITYNDLLTKDFGLYVQYDSGYLKFRIIKHIAGHVWDDTLIWDDNDIWDD